MKVFTGKIFSSTVCLLVFVFFVFISCRQKHTQHTYTIAFSQCVGNDIWRAAMLHEMKRELSFHDDIQFIYKDADGNSQLQVRQIDSLTKENIDLLIVSPNEVKPLSPIIAKVYRSGIPVVLVDRRTDSANYTAFVGASNFEIGETAGKYAISLLKGSGNIIEIAGLQDASPFIDRHEGFINAISKAGGIQYLQQVRDHTNDYPQSIEKALLNNRNVDLIFAQSDFLAYDAYKACKNTGRTNIKIIGIDGLASKGGGMEMVAKHYITSTLLYPTGGQEAIQTAIKILQGKPYTKEIHLATTIIDSNNVRIMQAQNTKLKEQQNNIDRSQQVIEQQAIVTQNQSLIIYAISVTLALAFIFGGILFYYLQENKKINLRLAHQNEEILSQRNQLIELGKQAQQASEAKINFFTNISHEFRTPITLLLAPLEDMKNNPRLDSVSKQSAVLMQKNALRLLKLVNELIDFRKIESGKYKLQVTENNLVNFVEETIGAFKTIARKKNIDLRLITKERNIMVWFDAPMMDKVLFNLLSNAFKFTGEGGYVYLALEKEAGSIRLKVEDNGIGMSPKFAAHAFELFYQENMGDKLGSGLGLSLSKELVQLHGGTITVESQQGKGTIFTIVLPLGKTHFTNDQFAANASRENSLHKDEVFLAQFTSTDAGNGKIAGDEKSDNTILIIEDNADLRHYLVQKLGENYQMLEAENGTTAIQQAFDEVPDLIVSDINLPGKDGFAITNILKTDIRTSHIPIILLTARTTIQEQIEGMKSKADAYISKPFNLQYLEETIKSTLRNREMLREHYTSQLPAELKSQPAAKKLDRKFINDFSAVVESNIDNGAFSAEDICKYIGISRVQLYRKVKALLGCNVNDYILNVRLQKAKYLLSESEQSIAEIADKTGFSSAAYFSTVFKQKFCMTPSEYKEGKVK